jgi:thiol-disulfide isomerase/thioredoxin
MREVWLTLAACVPLACGTGSAQSVTSVEVADIARIDAVLAQHRGHGVLLNFWATWCVPCCDEMPELVAAASEFKAQGADLVLISYDMLKDLEPKAVVLKVEDFAERHGIDAPILIYDSRDFDAMNAHFKMPGGVPVTLAFDRAGVLVDIQDGEADQDRFEEMLRKSLAK